MYIAVASVDGSTFNISKVNRLHMGPYLCIASNGVPPSVSKRIMLIVHCKSNYLYLLNIFSTAASAAHAPTQPPYSNFCLVYLLILFKHTILLGLKLGLLCNAVFGICSSPDDMDPAPTRRCF